MESYPPESIRRTKIQKVQHLKDLFGLSDKESLRLLDQHNGDLEIAVTFMGSRGATTAAEVADSSHNAPSAGEGNEAPSYAVDSATDPIDLTKENTDQDMQKALLLSMQDMQSTSGGGVLSLEEQELSRALEASLRETCMNLSKPMLLFQDPKNPHKRKRVGGTPVGLKNIGNTCWFSAVIQSLYHIPAFQQKILTYSPPPLPNGATCLPRCAKFVLELQKTFTLLLKSNKMYIDPSPAIQALQETFIKERRAQQDVSEFTHKLLEWIENAFKLSDPSESGNPIVNLFNGHFKTEGINNDEHFISESDFGAFPVQVRGHAHLHDSLESATFDTEMQQQTFFTRFPPILVLELSRFQYNQVTRQVEKVHDPLNFDPLLYVDRYLEENKLECCRRKRELDALRKRISELEERLHWYVSYRQKPISITDVLSLTLAFVCDEKTWDGEDPREEGPRGEEQAEKRARTSLHPSPRYKSELELETLQKCLKRWTEELSQDMEDLGASIATSKATLAAVYNDPLMSSTPYHLHAVMVHQGEAYGGHYWAYVRKHPSLSIPTPRSGLHSQDVGPSENSSSQSEGWKKTTADSEPSGPPGVGPGYHTQLETGEIYADAAHVGAESMVEVDESPLLPAVEGGGVAPEDGCVTGPLTPSLEDGGVTGHPTPSLEDVGVALEDGGGAGKCEGMEVERCGGQEGEVGGKEWMKFNDVSVCEVDWEEVRRESVGSGCSNTSAYCLVYINKLLHQDWLQSATPPSLSAELTQYVEESNGSFLKELVEYDRTIQAASHISSDVTVGSVGCPPSPLGVVMSPDLLASAAADSALPADPQQEERSPQELMQIDSPPAPPISPTLQTQLAKLIGSHHYRNHQLGTVHEEARPLSALTYAVLSDYPKHTIRLLALDHISFNQIEEKIKMLAKREYIHTLSLMAQENSLNPLETLKQNYHTFVSCCWFFVQAMKMTLDRNFTETLMLCLKASHLHKALRPPSNASLQRRHHTLLQSIKCSALQEVSGKAYRMFERGEVRDGIQIANTLVVPALAQLSRESGREEEAILERVREEWCQCLNRPDLSESEQDQLGDLLTRILDDSGKTPSLPDLCGSEEVDMDSLDRHTLVTDFTTYFRKLSQQQTDSFLGI